MTKIVACKWVRDNLPPLYEKYMGTKVDAITIGGETVYLNADPDVLNDPKLARHEQEHVYQQARYCPGWAKWLPLRLRAWLGLGNGYAVDYCREHLRVGYERNRFEVAARYAAQQDT